MPAPRRSHSAFAGTHKFKPDGANHFESFEVFYKARGAKKAAELAGWYWRPLPVAGLSSDDTGPFSSSRAAYRDACKQG